MARIGFFEFLVSDMDRNEWEGINQANDRADAALEQGNMLGTTVGSLRAVVKSQAKDIRHLQTALAVLAQVLEDAGVVDPKVLDYRIEAAIANEDAEVAAEAAMTTCVQCKQEVNKKQTNLTEFGVTCDRCFNNASG